MLQLFRKMLSLLAGTVIVLPLVLFLMQDGMIFYPPPAPPMGPRGQQVRTVRVEVAGGMELSGWLAHTMPPAPGMRRPLVIYFGGNAEEVSGMVGMAPELAPWSVLAVNYRGYGGNPGRPSEQALFADALAIFDWARSREDIDAERIVLMGRSLGSGVAVHVASERKPAGVILVTPFDSIRAVAQSVYPFLPVSLLLRHPFDSLERAPAIEAPMLTLAAGQDRVIAPRHARRLFDAWKGSKHWREFAAADHNDIASARGYWEAVRAFLSAGIPRPMPAREHVVRGTDPHPEAHD